MILQLRVLDDDGLIIRDERRVFGSDADLQRHCEHFIGSLQLLASVRMVLLAMESRALRAALAEQESIGPDIPDELRP